MSDKPPKRESHAQFGNAAQNSARADNLHGRRTPTHVGWSERPPVDGTAALKDAPKPPERPPIKAGTRFRGVATLVENGVKRLVEGVITILSARLEWVGWLYRVEFNGTIQFFYWKIEDIIEAWRSWWSRPRRLEEKREGAVQTLPSAPAPSLLALPAPQTTIAGLLPERCA